MKTALIATLFALAATAATAQLAAPINPGADPTVGALPSDARITRAQLHVDREKVKADKERLKAARAARDDDAIRNAQASLRADMATWHVDRGRGVALDSAESTQH